MRIFARRLPTWPVGIVVFGCQIAEAGGYDDKLKLEQNMSPHNKGDFGGVGEREMSNDKDLRAAKKVRRFSAGRILSDSTP